MDTNIQSQAMKPGIEQPERVVTIDSIMASQIHVTDGRWDIKALILATGGRRSLASECKRMRHASSENCPIWLSDHANYLERVTKMSPDAIASMDGYICTEFAAFVCNHMQPGLAYLDLLDAFQVQEAVYLDRSQPYKSIDGFEITDPHPMDQPSVTRSPATVASLTTRKMYAGDGLWRTSSLIMELGKAQSTASVYKGIRVKYTLNKGLGWFREYIEYLETKMGMAPNRVATNDGRICAELAAHMCTHIQPDLDHDELLKAFRARPGMLKNNDEVLEQELKHARHAAELRKIAREYADPDATTHTRQEVQSIKDELQRVTLRANLLSQDATDVTRYKGEAAHHKTLYENGQIELKKMRERLERAESDARKYHQQAFLAQAEIGTHERQSDEAVSLIKYVSAELPSSTQSTELVKFEPIVMGTRIRNYIDGLELRVEDVDLDNQLLASRNAKANRELNALMTAIEKDATGPELKDRLKAIRRRKKKASTKTALGIQFDQHRAMARLGDTSSYVYLMQAIDPHGPQDVEVLSRLQVNTMFTLTDEQNKAMVWLRFGRSSGKNRGHQHGELYGTAVTLVGLKGTEKSETAEKMLLATAKHAALTTINDWVVVMPDDAARLYEALNNLR